ncbi:MAG: hypothetical protein K8H88_33405 [Sandaracinaceae bacterium]|nr:hypothetical protein [Sandaracinaceae bacterium]
MTAIPESLVAQVVADVSKRMGDPTFAQVAIGQFVEAHPDVGRWLAAQSQALGGSEGVMNAVFHAEILVECFRRHTRSEPPSVRFAVLDAATKKGDALAALRAIQPALADFVHSNVESDAMKRALCLVGLALHATAR